MRGLVVALALLSACKSERKKAYEQLAAEVNPVVVELRPYAARVLAMPTKTRLEDDRCLKSPDPAMLDACIKEPAAAVAKWGPCAADDAQCIRHACTEVVWEQCTEHVCATSDAELAQLSAIDHTACQAAEPTLTKLGSINFDDGKLDSLREAAPAMHAHWLIDVNRVACVDDGDPPHTDIVRCHRILRCSRKCFDIWNGLVRDIEEVHKNAARHGVDIELLVPPPSAPPAPNIR